MAFLFKKNGYYYISLSYKGTRIRRSLGTTSKRTAQRNFQSAEQAILRELISGGRSLPKLNRYALLDAFLKAKSHLSEDTIKWYHYNITKYFKTGLVKDKT
ncbi:MAG: hypothetical protein QGF36_07210, partial [Candidatus Marinimicrobia bacterium]|nr:hypothetical protein [Candidatus Neomarinimicrobiota bacterium]